VQDGIDPIGACVGQRGVRIQAVTKELNGERVDVIEWSPDPARFIANALQPAQVLNVIISEDANGDKVARVIVDDKALSLAIGKEGQNARLAAKLTGCRIDIKKIGEVQEEAARKEAEEAARRAAMTPEEIAIEQAAIQAAQQAQVDQIAQAAEEAVVPAPTLEPETPVVAAEPAAAVDASPIAPEPVAEAAPEAEEPATFAEALAEFEAEDEDDENLSPEEKAKRKADKSKRQVMVFDEELGKVVAKRKRKSSRAQDWEEVEE